MINLPPLTAELARRYEAVGILGHGSFATVIAARNRQSGERVAIKHIPAAGKGRLQFTRELHLLMDLVHPNIVRCLDLCTADEEWSSLVLEYADAGSLRDRLTASGVTPDEAWRVLADVGRGLAAAHARNVIHRDMKPENILCFSGTEGLTFKISDFGIARSLGLLERAHTSIGSPAYMAPEQFYDEYGPKCDVYALGIIFFELLHGRPAYQGSPASIFKAHLESPLPVDSGCDRRTTTMLHALTAKRPEERMSAAELVDELGRLGFLENENHPEPRTARAATGVDLRVGDFFGDAFGSSESAPAAPADDARRASAPATASTRADAFFGGMFEDAPPKPATFDRDRSAAVDLECGALTIKRGWSRATETQTERLINFDDGRGPFVVAGRGIYELRADASRGDSLPVDGSCLIGTPCQGSALLATGDSVRLLHRRSLSPLDWTLAQTVDDLFCAPDLGAVAVRRGGEIFYHRADGSLAWHGRFEPSHDGLWCGFDSDNRLLVAAIGATDGVLTVIGDDGTTRELPRLPGAIVSISRCRFGSGCWAIVATADGARLLRVTADGVLGEPRPVGLHLRELLGARGWIAGRDEAGGLHVIDPATGDACALPVQGTVLAYEQGAEEDELYVLEQRGELLRYVTAFELTSNA